MLKMRVRSTVWLYEGPGGWHFVTLPARRAREIREAVRGIRRGWGSVRVKATVGSTTWRTSLFPDAKSGSYVLPIKADVRAKEGLGEGDKILISLEVAI